MTNRKRITRREFGGAGSAAVIAAARPAFLRGAPAEPQPGVKLWLETSLRRIFPNSPAANRSELSLVCARNQKLSFQACVRNESTQRLRVECSASGSPDIRVQVRRVGYVPMPHHTTGVPVAEIDGIENILGLVPDPLFPEQTADVGPRENQSFWISLSVPPDVHPGARSLKVVITSEQERNRGKVILGELTARLDVRS